MKSTIMGFLASVGVILVVAPFLGSITDGEPEPLNTDPIYNANLNGSAPQIVRQYQEGDDIKPNLHTVYYYPELDQYEVVVIMGKDR